jgi:hypothetical protein
LNTDAVRAGSNCRMSEKLARECHVPRRLWRAQQCLRSLATPSLAGPSKRHSPRTFHGPDDICVQVNGALQIATCRHIIVYQGAVAHVEGVELDQMGAGFWIALLHSTGLSSTDAVWPRRTAFTQFSNNTAHSNRSTGMNSDDGRIRTAPRV